MNGQAEDEIKNTVREQIRSEEKIYMGAVQTAKIIRKVLKDKFPGIKFSVRSETYSMGSSININWTDGPNTKEVDQEIKIYSSSGFDGMIDLKYYINHWLLPDGSVIVAHDQGSTASGGMDPEILNPKPHPNAKLVSFGADHVFTNRKISLAKFKIVLEKVCNEYGCEIPPISGSDTNPYIEYVHDPRAHEGFGQTVRDLVNKEICETSFFNRPDSKPEIQPKIEPKENIELDNVLKDAGLTITEKMTTPTRPGKKPRPVWTVTGITKGFEKIFRELGGRTFKGIWSFYNDPTNDLIEMIKSEGRLTFEQKQEYDRDRAAARAERMEDRALAANKKSMASYQKSKSITDHIPMGQPILIGHHSERRHRRDLERSDNAMRKSIEENEKSEHYGHRAEIARKKAEGKHTIPFMARRLDEAEKYIRLLERNLEVAKGSENKDWQKKLEILLTETKQKKEYWQNEIDKAGGIKFQPDQIEIGNWVKYRGAWYKVVRINKKSVTVKGWLDIDHWTWKVKYSEIQKVSTINPLSGAK